MGTSVVHLSGCRFQALGPGRWSGSTGAVVVPGAGRRSSLGPPPRPRSGQVLQVLHSHVAELHQVGVAVVLQPDVAAVELPQEIGRASCSEVRDGAGTA